MTKLRKNVLIRPNADKEVVSISARLTGDFADMWQFITQCTGEETPTVIVRDAIRLLAFAVHQSAAGQKISTTFVDDENGELQTTKVDDIVNYLGIISPNRDDALPGTIGDVEQSNKDSTNHKLAIPG